MYFTRCAMYHRARKRKAGKSKQAILAKDLPAHCQLSSLKQSRIIYWPDVFIHLTSISHRIWLKSVLTTIRLTCPTSTQAPFLPSTSLSAPWIYIYWTMNLCTWYNWRDWVTKQYDGAHPALLLRRQLRQKDRMIRCLLNWSIHACKRSFCILSSCRFWGCSTGGNCCDHPCRFRCEGKMKTHGMQL